jgi:hypothetical protein
LARVYRQYIYLVLSVTTRSIDRSHLLRVRRFLLRSSSTLLPGKTTSRHDICAASGDASMLLRRAPCTAVVARVVAHATRGRRLCATAGRLQQRGAAASAQLVAPTDACEAPPLSAYVHIPFCRRRCVHCRRAIVHCRRVCVCS